MSETYLNQPSIRDARRRDAERFEPRRSVAPAPDAHHPSPLLVIPPAALLDPTSIVPRSRSERAQWLLNAALAVVVLILASPVLVLVALAVKLSSPGPALYTQTRVGIDRRWNEGDKHDERRKRDLGGAPFKIYKFRTMYIDAEARGGEVWATQDDPRVTPIGRVLRQYRIDELPQLINVIRGEMHIVGPRPERPGILAELRQGIAEYPIRQRVKPGITGLAQISQNYDTSLEDVRRKVHFDIEYLQTQSFAEDFRIMAKTVPVILFRRGGW